MPDTETPELERAPKVAVDSGVVVPLDGRAVTVTTGTRDEMPNAELRLPEEARAPEFERLLEAVADPETPVPLEG